MDSIDQDEIDGNINQSEYAGFWIRFGATIIDGICLAPLTIFQMFYNNTELKMLELAILGPVIIYLYKLLMEYKFGATLGKMAVKIKVVNDINEPITFNQALGRSMPWLLSTFSSCYAAYQLFQHSLFDKAHSYETVQQVQMKTGGEEIQMVVGILFVIIAVMIGNDARKQGFHDKTAGTFVVYK